MSFEEYHHLNYTDFLIKLEATWQKKCLFSAFFSSLWNSNSRLSALSDAWRISLKLPLDQFISHLFTYAPFCPRSYLRWLVEIKFLKIQNTINQERQMTFMLHETLLFRGGSPEDDVEKGLQPTWLLTKNEWHNQSAMSSISWVGGNNI